MYLRVLGTLALELPDQPAAGAAAQRQPLALLAVLAAAGPRGVTRERLHALLWPERDAERARAALNQTLYLLRRDTGVRDLAAASGPVLALAPDARGNGHGLTCDLWAFERAAAVGNVDAALAAYAGPFLDGVMLPRAAEFERWADAERARLAARLARLLADAARAASAAGDHARAAALWARRVEGDLMDGAATAAWMQALAAAGDRAGALRAAARHAGVARADYDAEPAAEVVALAEALRRSATPPGGAARSAAPSPAAAVPARAASSAGVGRADDALQTTTPAGAAVLARQSAEPVRPAGRLGRRWTRLATAGLAAVFLVAVVLVAVWVWEA